MFRITSGRYYHAGSGGRPLSYWYGIALLALATLVILPVIPQDPGYHVFADRHAWFGIPNFWNVVSNIWFLAVAVYALKLAGKKGSAYRLLLAGMAGVAVGSSYYHWRPDDTTLFWDRLPMTVVFMSLIAVLAGERFGSEVESRVLPPLLTLGLASVLWWSFTDDLRLYVVVQFGCILAVISMLVVGRWRTSLRRPLWWMVALYVTAKALELADSEIARYSASGGHPWKHAVAAAAMFVFVRALVRRDTNVTVPALKAHASAIQ